jgi:hypothetical protein
MEHEASERKPTKTKMSAEIKLEKQSDSALLEMVKSDWEKIEQLAANAHSAELDAANIMRKIGIALKELSGKEQLTLTFFQGIQDKLPQKLGFKSARACIKFADTYKEPISNLQQLRPIQRELMLVAGEHPEQEKQKRIKDEPKNLDNWTVFVAKLCAADAALDELEKESPMVEWDARQIESFINTTMRMANKIKQAQVLMSLEEDK